MTAAEFLAAFPAIKTDYGTGGNCTAWYIDLSHPKTGAWFGVLITSIEEPYQPSLTDRRADFGMVNDGEGVEPRVMTWAQAAHWLNGIMDFRDHLTRWAP